MRCSEFPDPKAGKKKGGKPKAADDEEEAEKGSGTATPQPAADEDDGTPKVSPSLSSLGTCNVPLTVQIGRF